MKTLIEKIIAVVLLVGVFVGVPEVIFESFLSHNRPHELERAAGFTEYMKFSSGVVYVTPNEANLIHWQGYFAVIAGIAFAILSAVLRKKAKD